MLKLSRFSVQFVVPAALARAVDECNDLTVTNGARAATGDPHVFVRPDSK